MHTTVENGMVAGLGKVYAAQDRAADCQDSAHIELRNAFLDALMAGPESTIDVPVHKTSACVGIKTVPLVEVLSDDFTTDAGEEGFRELLRLLVRCADGKLDKETNLRAMALVTTMAARFATNYEGDMQLYYADSADDGMGD